MARPDLREVYLQDVLTPQDRAALVKLQRSEAKAEKALEKRQSAPKPLKRTLKQSERHYWAVWFCYVGMIVLVGVASINIQHGIQTRRAHLIENQIAQCEFINHQRQTVNEFAKRANAARGKEVYPYAALVACRKLYGE